MHRYLYDRLQSVMRAAARLVLRLPKWTSVSETMRNKFHWLPYPERVDFKLCSTIYKCLHNIAPQYLIELCIEYRSPRSRDVVICDRLHTATSSYRRRLPRPLALVDFFMLAQWPGTAYSLFLKTHLCPSQCLKNCWKQNCLTEFCSQLHAPLW